MSRISTGGWFSMLAVVIFALICIEHATTAYAHDGTKGHTLSQVFSFDYNAEHGVYCGWRHSYEGISCVNVDE